MLYLDKNALTTAEIKYNTYSQGMMSLKNKLDSAVDDIRDSWKSYGGNEFFTKFDDEWKNNFQDYINVIQHMADNMKEARDRYEEIYDEADNLKL